MTPQPHRQILLIVSCAVAAAVPGAATLAVCVRALNALDRASRPMVDAYDDGYETGYERGFKEARQHNMRVVTFPNRSA